MPFAVDGDFGFHLVLSCFLGFALLFFVAPIFSGK
jgi:hypothetical protein